MMREPRREEIETLARTIFGAKCRLLAWHPVSGQTRDLVIFATLVFPARVVVIKLAGAESARPPLARLGGTRLGASIAGMTLRSGQARRSAGSAP